MGHLIDDDIVSVLRRTPKLVFDSLKEHRGLFMAGGFLRACIAHEEVNDIDMFVESKDYGKAVAESLAKAYAKPLIETDNAWTIRCRPAAVQVIHRWTFKEPYDALASFDFSVAQAAIWWDGSKWMSACSDRFYPDLAAKRLVYLSPKRNEDAGGSMIRVLKFYQRGYRIPLDSLGAVMSRMYGGMKLSDDNEALLIHDEQYRAKILTGLLREVDPNSNPDRYIAPSPDNEPTPDQ